LRENAKAFLGGIIVAREKNSTAKEGGGKRSLGSKHPKHPAERKNRKYPILRKSKRHVVVNRRASKRAKKGGRQEAFLSAIHREGKEAGPCNGSISQLLLKWERQEKKKELSFSTFRRGKRERE